MQHHLRGAVLQTENSCMLPEIVKVYKFDNVLVCGIWQVQM